MYLINLFPYFARNNPVSYSWIGAVAASRLGPRNVFLIGSKLQLLPPSKQIHGKWISNEVHSITDDDWMNIPKIEIPDILLNKLYDQSEDGFNFLNEISSQCNPDYVTHLVDAITSSEYHHNITAAFSLANDKSFQEACTTLNIRVIYSEQGPIREPTSSFSTFYFDFQGINGRHSFNAIYEQAKSEIDTSLFIDRESLINNIYKERHSEINRLEYYEIGAALQVEDDSNLIAYSNGISTLQLLFKSLWVFPRELILIRQHPLSKFYLKGNDFGTIDNSPSSIEFLYKCKRLVTINSSVAFESILLGKETYVLGISPFNVFTEASVDRHLKYPPRTEDDRKYFLNIFLFLYLIPQWFWLNKKYFDFRLTNPSLQEIFNLHIESYKSRGYFN